MCLSPRIAVVGCGHGCLNEIYATVEAQATARGWTDVDCVIIGGDFQALRNANDAACISVPAKYKQMGDFHEYYSGQRKAPYLTIFCAGNHEASNYLFELYYGGWVAPNIYYLGAANIIRLGSLRISAMSGIWKGYDYRKPHFERLPYNSEDVQSIYHIRELDVRKLLQVRTQVDIGLSHDWPRGIERFGDQHSLFRMKKHLREDSTHGRLGSPAAREVIDRLRPAYWFSAHLHVKFALVMSHDGARTRQVTPNRYEPEAWAHEEIVQSPDPAEPLINLDGTRSPERDTVSEVRPAHGTTASRISAWNKFGEKARQAEHQEAVKIREEFGKSLHPTTMGRHIVTYKIRAKGNSKSFVKYKTVVFDTKKKQKLEELVQNTDEIDLDASSNASNGSPERNGSTSLSVAVDGANESKLKPSLVDQAVAQDVRAKLPASLARPPVARNDQIARKVVPREIHNRTTKFLALDKPGGHSPYIQLVEIKPISDSTNANIAQPLRLQYDKEWLAITRAFAKDLQLGDPSAMVPNDLGEESYRPAILEAEAWVEENVVAKGLMEVPNNFALTAPVYDAQIPVTTTVIPPEYTNPQTAAFCDLLKIPNPFDLSEQEREARFDAGPRSLLRPESEGKRRGGRGGRGRRGRGSGR